MPAFALLRLCGSTRYGEQGEESAADERGRKVVHGLVDISVLVMFYDRPLAFYHRRAQHVG
jgi:hypothetical protein